MEFQQVYNEDDIKTIHKLFCKKNESVSRFGKVILGETGIVVIAIFAFFLIDCLTVANMMFVAGAVSCVIMEDVYRLVADWSKRRKVYKLLYQKYCNPVTLRFDDIFMVYRDRKYYYDNISFIIYYDKYVFVFCAGKFIPLIKNYDINQLLQEKIEQYNNIQFRREVKLFSISSYDKLS